MTHIYDESWRKPAEALAEVELPAVSQHAAQRWDERTPVDSVAPEKAWDEAEPQNVVDAAIAAHIEAHSESDEARYHDPTGTALLRKDVSITTVLPSSDPRIREAIEHIDPDPSSGVDA